MSPREVLTFLGVGGVGYVVDVAAFNLLRAPVGDAYLARGLAVVVAMVVTYLGNRWLTWRDPASEHRRREVALFVVFNVIGFAISAACLAFSHQVLGLTSVAADNISANLVGVGLGTAFRFATYRRFVFAATPAPSSSTSGTTVPRVLIVSASIGAGHDGAARELARRATVEGYAVDRVDFLDLLPLGLGRLLRATYHLQLRAAPSTWGPMANLLGSTAGLHAARLTSWLAGRRLLAACHPEPCLAISTYPLASHALSRLRLRGEFWSPVVTYLTDMSVHPLWIAPGVDAHLALHDVSAAAARALGARGVEVVGPAVDPAFTPTDTGTRHCNRADLGLTSPLDPRPLALVVAGSWGVGEIDSTVTDLAATGRVRPVVVCGTNHALAAALGPREGIVTLGWVDDMAALMSACDLVIQNAGGLTSLEARQTGLPVITYRSLPGHGLSNSAALEEAGWATWARTEAELATCLDHALLTPVAAAPPGRISWDRLVTGLDPVSA